MMFPWQGSVKRFPATEPAWNGYLLTVACRYGVVFEQRDTLHPSSTLEKPAKSLI